MKDELIVKIGEYIVQTELLNAAYSELESRGKTDAEVFELTKDLVNSKMKLAKEIYDMDNVMGNSIIIDYGRIKSIYSVKKRICRYCGEHELSTEITVTEYGELCHKCAEHWRNILAPTKSRI